MGYLPLIRKDSINHMHGIAVYVKEGLPFARDLSLENSADFYLCFRLALLHSVSYVSVLLSSIDHILRLYARFLILFHLTQMRLLLCLPLEAFTFIITTG